MAAPERTRIPERWSLPESIRDRLGENLGRARAMVAEQHLLLILHAVPRGAASEGVVFHRDPMGAWQSTERGGLGALEALVTSYEQELERLESSTDQARTSDERFARASPS